MQQTGAGKKIVDETPNRSTQGFQSGIATPKREMHTASYIFSIHSIFATESSEVIQESGTRPLT